ncbi:MAG: hypothetical protein K2X55_20860 [Burkholderiaceae bacterium]|nr:hypothetical protein [Burkholderiaceae bacterium]
MKIENLTKLASLALVAGCSSPAPVAQRVEIPVFTPCVKVVPERPTFEFDNLPADASDGAKVLALARDWARGRKYEGELEAIVSGCGPINI